MWDIQLLTNTDQREGYLLITGPVSCKLLSRMLRELEGECLVLTLASDRCYWWMVRQVFACVSWRIMDLYAWDGWSCVGVSYLSRH